MTARTWIGGQSGNNGMAAANWSPAGAPQPGDNLSMVTGTLALLGSNLGGDVLHIAATGPGTGPVNLDLNGSHAALEADGAPFFGDPLTVNVLGHDTLKADDLAPIQGTINVGANSVLTLKGDMHFLYTGALNGPGTISNYGTISLADGTISANINGNGVINFHRYHDGAGVQTISGSISSGQDVQLQADEAETLTTLVHPDTFHGALDILPPNFSSGSPAVSEVVLNGVTATAFRTSGDHLVLLNGQGRPVDSLTVHNPGNASISLGQTAAGSSITFAFHSTGA